MLKGAHRTLDAFHSEAAQSAVSRFRYDSTPVMIKFLLALVLMVLGCGAADAVLHGAVVGGVGSSDLYRPGPSQTLFNAPYYVCGTNYYVNNNSSAGGSDSNDGLAPTSGGGHGPWLTLQHADSANVGAGNCINAVASATTYAAVTINHGGSTATPSGYLVWRCTVMDGCTVNGGSGNGFGVVWISDGANPNFIIIDGFTLVGNASGTGAGFNAVTGSGASSTAVQSHHLWLFNSVVQNFGQSGVQLNQGDYIYIVHNTFSGNSTSSCFLGSGISMTSARNLSYSETSDDINGNAAKFGYSWNIGGGNHFHMAVIWNVVHNNYITACGSSDGNGIIFDTFLAPGNGVNYTQPVLAGHNVTYNNGGTGVHCFQTTYCYLVNNSSFNENQAANVGGSRPNMDDNAGTPSTPDAFYNNISVAIATTTSPFGANHAFNVGPASSGGAGTPAGNITYPVPPTNPSANGARACPTTYEVQLFSGQSYSTSANKCATNPGWANVTFGSPGNTATPPTGTNFALCTAAAVPNAGCAGASPAIGFGTLLSWMPSTAIDSGACGRAFTTCP